VTLVENCITDESYNESIRVLQRILSLSVSKLALETGVQEDATDVVAFYEQKPVPPPEAEGPILVAQADGKGVPMIRDEPAPRPARRSKGQKRTKKKETVVTAIYTIEPYRRTPQEVVKALLRDLTGDEEAKPTLRTEPFGVTPQGEASTSQLQRPVPVGKEVRATLEGKDIAFDRLAERVAQRDGKHIQQRVALTDGDEALQNHARDRLSNFNLVLDIIHASEYLWDAANVVLGETHPDRSAWVGEQLLQILSGKATAVIQTLESLAQDPSLSR
jgi:hypothetical protein